MGVTDFPGGSSPSSPTGAFSSDTGEVYSDSINFPQGRIAANGQGPIRLHAVAAWIAGRFSNVTCYIRVDTAETAGFTNGIDDSNPPPSTGWRGIALLVPNGGARRVALRADGAYRFGRGGGGTTYKPSSGFTWTDGSLVGQAAWAEVPAAPTSPVATPGVGEATLNWVTPSDEGGSAITGYQLRYSTASNMSGATVVDLGVVTSHLITGLTNGLTYYFDVAAKNLVSTDAGTVGPRTSVVSAFIAAAPGAPTALTITNSPGVAGASWTAPASDGGSAVLDYELQVATDSGFSSIVSTQTGIAALLKSVVGLAPNTTHWARVRARNAVGNGAWSTSATWTTPARTFLEVVEGAAIHVAGGVMVSIRSDGANPAVLTLGYSALTDGTTWTSIATLSGFYKPGGAQNVTVVADPVGNLYVVGIDASNTNAIRVVAFTRTGSTNAWTPASALTQTLASTGDPLFSVQATYVPGTGVTPKPTIFLLVRRAGQVGSGALSWATIDAAVALAGSGTLFVGYGSDPPWLAAPTAGDSANSGTLDLTTLTGIRVVGRANGFFVVDVTNGVVAGVSKAVDGTTGQGTRVRAVAVDASTFFLARVIGNDLSWVFYGTNGSVLGSGTIAGANAQGGAFSRQWDAFYNRASGKVSIFYVADDSARKIERVDITPGTYVVGTAVVVTSTMGAASSANSTIRLPRHVVDERRVLIEAANLLTGTQSLAVLDDTSGNVAPSAPARATLPVFDASVDQVFAWTFGDTNPADAQLQYDLQIQRTSDSVNVVDVSNVASAVGSRTVAGATLVNGTTYRWRVRTKDALGTVGAWSSYSSDFTPSSVGTLTITDPATDNPAGLESSSKTIAWTYSQANGYTQTQRRVRVVRTSNSSVLSDTTMQASTATTFDVVGMLSGVEYQIELSITNSNAQVASTTRLVTPDYDDPMTPTAVLTVGVNYVDVTVTNPEPTGSRPDVATNDILRRLAGTDDPFVRIAIVGKDETYRDRAVAAGVGYDYQIRGVTA